MTAKRTSKTSAPDQIYSPAEWDLRVELAACYRLLARFGFSDLAGAHVSAKIPGTEYYVLNAYGSLFEDVTASSLVAVDLDGKIVSGQEHDLNAAGTAIHGAVHRARAVQSVALLELVAAPPRFDLVLPGPGSGAVLAHEGGGEVDVVGAVPDRDPPHGGGVAQRC